MKALVVVLWLVAAGTAGAAVFSLFSTAAPASGPDSARLAKRTKEAGRRLQEMKHQEEEERHRRQRIDSGAALPGPSTGGPSSSDRDVDAIQAMTDLSEEIRNRLLIVRHPEAELFGLKDSIQKYQIPAIKERLKALGIADDAADAAAGSLADLLAARHSRGLAVYEAVGSTDAKEGADLLAAHNRLEAEFHDSMHRQLRERMEQALGPERGAAATEALESGFPFNRHNPVDALRGITQQLPDEFSRQAFERRLEETLSVEIKAGRASLSSHNELLLTPESAQAVKQALTGARESVPSDHQDNYDSWVEWSLKYGLDQARLLQGVVGGLRRLPKK